jgi:enamine deaminase RidA (YjgF/YER057c/UK114 family)
MVARISATGNKKGDFIMPTIATTAEERLAKLDIHLPEPPAPFGAYVTTVQTGNLLFLSGFLASSGHAVTMTGALGKELDVNAGRKAMQIAALNGLARIRKSLGSLNRVSRVVRLGMSIVTTPEFKDHAKVADAASELFRDVLGEETVSTRLIIGVASLPFGSPVALEIIVEVKTD